MTLAIRGDRTSCLSLQLGPGTWLLAVARGFGQIGGTPTETALLSRLRLECRAPDAQPTLSPGDRSPAGCGDGNAGDHGPRQ